MTLDVFSDASQSAWGVMAGAYAIGQADPIGVLFPDCETVQDAELLTLAVAIIEGRASDPAADIVAHSDLANIGRLMWQRKTQAALALHLAASNFRAKVVADAKYWDAYVRCHHEARQTAGISYRKHAQPEPFPQDLLAVDAVADVLRNYPSGVTQAAIAELTCLDASSVQKALRYLEKKNRARVERPSDPVAGCDLHQLRWLRGASFGTRLGTLLAEAGINA